MADFNQPRFRLIQAPGDCEQKGDYDRGEKEPEVGKKVGTVLPRTRLVGKHGNIPSGIKARSLPTIRHQLKTKILVSVCQVPFGFKLGYYLYVNEVESFFVPQPKMGDRLKVTAHPRAKCPRVVAGLDGAFNVYVAEPPEGGRANKAIQRALADYLDMAPSLLELVSGESFKQKIFEVN